MLNGTWYVRYVVLLFYNYSAVSEQCMESLSPALFEWFAYQV